MTSPNARTLQLSVPPEGDMYRAIAARDAQYDGRFFYGVVTTGVYCRPSCAARPARRDNLRLFPDAESAERAGFRPCKRCRPDRADSEIERLVEIAAYIVEHAEERLTLAGLSKRVGLSPSRFQKAFKAVIGASPKAFQDAIRLEKFKGALKDGDDVTGAIYAAGFGSASRVYGEASRNMGMTPAAYRAGGKGESISYAYRSSAVGPLMMAATDRGVCFAQFGASLDELREQLSREFPNADIQESPASSGEQLNQWIDALDAFLQDNGPRPDLPLDLRGTAFQLKVWRFLLGIDEGEVVSYGELAAGIGRPDAVRAVASAVGANRVAVLVPCHRVLRGNGELGGYRWGLDRKRTLLDIERKKQARVE